MAGIPAGKGLIKIFKTGEGTLALVVTGDSSSKIRDAAEVLKDYKRYSLSGNKEIVD
jgi:hypothetical protein